MQQVFLAVYFAGIPALCTFALYKFARIWLWAAPIIATLLGTVMMTVYLGGLPVPTDERWLTFWEVLMPVQQLIAISICLGVLVGMRWGGSGTVLGLMAVAVTGSALLIYPLCLLLYGAVLLLSFTGRARKAWEEYRQGNNPEL